MAEPNADDVVDNAEDEAPTPAKDDSRDRELSGIKAVREQLLGGEKETGIWDNIESGFTAQADRANAIMDNWDAYNCRLANQFYNGTSRVFFPIIPNAIRARGTRFANQAFPNSGRYIDAVTANGEIPFAEMALMEHYIRRLRLKNTIVKPLLKNGDIEGNYSIYVDWEEHTRNTMTRRPRPVQEGGEDKPEYGEVDDVLPEEVVDAGPRIEVISDADLLILPVTAPTVADALAQGGSVTIRRRYTKATIKAMMEDGDIGKAAGKKYLDAMQSATDDDQAGRKDTAKRIGEAAGIRVRKGITVGVVAEVWTRLKVDGERRLCRAYIGGEDQLLGVKLNPFWHDRCPLITEPVDRTNGGIKGRAPVADVMDQQMTANDMVNQSIDTSSFSAMPIVMADPVANPKSSTMVLGLGAVWDVDPEKVKFVSFPALYKELLPFIERIETAIFQTLGVNPAMLPQSTGKPGAKRNQAEIAMETMVDILTTADAVSVLEDVLNQALIMFCELDHQFRDKPILVREFGPMGRKANMQQIEPLQMGRQYEFTWLGVEAARNAAMAQQQIAAAATMMKIPPSAIPGYKINLAPVLQQIALSQFGPRIAPLTLVDLKDEQSMDPAEENMMMFDGIDMPVHPMDDDLKHMQAHMASLQQTGDPHGTIRWHIDKHNMQRVAKATAASQQRGMQGPGQAGAPPQPGAQPGSARPGPRLPGAINEDRMSAAGAPGMPRKT